MKFDELLVTAYDGEKPVFAVSVELDQAVTLLTAVDEAGVVEAAQLRVKKFDVEQPCATRASAAQLLRALHDLAQDVGMFDESEDGGSNDPPGT